MARHAGCTAVGVRAHCTDMEVDVEDQEDRTPREDGTEPVQEHPPEVPGPGRTPMQYAVIVLGVLVLLAALLWFFLPAA